MVEPSVISALRVLVVDDEKNIRASVVMCVEALGCEVEQAASREQALERVRRSRFDLAFLDLRLGEAKGLDLIPELLRESPELDIVIITAYATFDTAVEAIRRGARDYLPKPFTPAQVRHAVMLAAERSASRAHIRELRGRLQETMPEIELTTRSKRMESALELSRRAAASEAPVLLRGESGTGKGVLARMIHAESPRRGRPFVVVNCPTLTDELLASELFGHARGAFTGAVRDQEGRVEAAEGGTLFLDEIGEISPALQAKLLRFVQEKQFERVGETRTRSADVRVVAATNRDLEADVRSGRFREDLWYRLNVVEVVVPPLRERAEDVLPLTGHFLGFFARAMRRPVPELSSAAEHVLVHYRWPGNIRELRNAIERALIVWPGQVLEPQAFPERIAGEAVHVPTVGGDFTLEEVEREHIQSVLARTSTLDEAARVLGIDASTLYRKRKKYEP